MAYDFKNIKRCGAKTRKGTPCQGPAMTLNGRCRMHNGGSSRLKHGRFCQKAEKERQCERVFLKEMRKLNQEIDDLIGVGNVSEAG